MKLVNQRGETMDEIVAQRQSPAESHLNIGQKHLILSLAPHRFFTFPADYFSRTKVRAELFAEAGFFMSADCKSLKCKFCPLKITDLRKWGKLVELNEMMKRHQKKSANCPLLKNTCQNVPMGNHSTLNNYKLESHRLFSLLRSENQHQWKVVTPWELSVSGFYYAGEADNVRCAFCSLEVRGWEKGDTAEGEHRRWNPECPFLKNPENVGNVPIGKEIHPNDMGHDGISTSQPAVPFGGKYGGNIQLKPETFILSPSVLKIHEHTPPKYEKFSTYVSRMKTYKGWPKSMVQQPPQLAAAGLFYSGIGDRVICFQCGLGLKEWARTDTPWEQHLKWSQACPFVMLTKSNQIAEQELQEDQKMEVDGGASEATSFQCRKCAREICAVSLPCGHMNLCQSCSHTEEKCRYCQEFVSASIKVFLN